MTIHMPMATAARMAPPAATPAAARVAPLSGGQAAIFFDLDPDALGRGTRLAARCDGRPFDGPVAVTRLSLSSGRERHVLIAARPAAELCRSAVDVEAAGRAVAAIDPAALQSPLVDPLALITGLDEAGARRLLRLLLTTGASLFGKGDLGAFGLIVGQLIEGQTAAVPLASHCRVGRGAAALSWRVPADSPRLTRDLCILTDGKALRFTEFEAIEEQRGAERVVHLLISRPLPRDADIIVLGERPIRLSRHGGEVVRDLTDWLGRRPAGVRAQVLSWLDDLAGGEAEVAALRDELACPPDQAPRIEPLYLAEAPNGILAVVAVDDPRGLLAALRVSVGTHAADMPCQTLVPLRGRSVACGFLPTPGRGAGTAEIAPVFASGRIGAALGLPTTDFDGAVPGIFDGLPWPVAADALSRAVPAAMRNRPVWRRRTASFGPRATSPAMAIVAAVGDTPEHLHALIAAVATEAPGKNTEIVLHHGEGPTTSMPVEVAETLSAVHRIGIRVVSVAGPALPSEVLRAALAEIRAPRCLVVGPDCLPRGTGWLKAWRRRIAASSEARAIVAGARDWDGGNAAGYALGLNAAAIARLLGARPLLPGVTGDLSATAGIASVRARGLDVAGFAASASASATPATGLVDAVEAAILTDLRRSNHG